MSELNASIADQFTSTFTQGAQETASAYSRTFGIDITLEPGQAGSFDFGRLRKDFSVPGLMIGLVTSGTNILVLIPSQNELIPDWCKAPDATGKSKLLTFAQELGMNLVPEDFFPEDYRAEMVADLAKATEEGQPGVESGYAELLIEHQGQKTTALFVWPVEDLEKVFAASPISAATTGSSTANTSTANTSTPSGSTVQGLGNSATSGTASGTSTGIPDLGFAGAGFATPPPLNAAFAPFGGGQSFSSEPVFDPLEPKHLSPDDLPGFSRSVMKIRVPVAVVLARARRPIKTILELGVGSVVQFDKSCDDPLELEVGNTIVAHGEAVKVGERFGLRLSTILLPKERFRPVQVRREGEYTKRQQRPPQIIGKAPLKSFEPQPQ
ncbi:MAG: FliM/FliN family flagellar motor switch protein [Thermoguttaceae bacterium]